MFQFIYNLFYTIFYSVWSIILCIITGKIPKISTYQFDHSSHGNNFFNICNDKFIKTNTLSQVSDECKKNIIYQYLNKKETIDLINSDLVRNKLIENLHTYKEKNL